MMTNDHPVTRDEVEKARQVLVDLRVRAEMHAQSAALRGLLQTACVALEYSTIFTAPNHD